VRRSTQQRQAISRTITEADRPLSATEILQAASRLSPGLGLATVYRNVNRMVESGEIRPVSLPGAGQRYERAGKGHHHHFHCARCDRVFEVPDCPGDVGALAPRGFKARRHEIILYGLCPSCARNGDQTGEGLEETR
jgi:Fur family ferric uptake transcriptional regulator